MEDQTKKLMNPLQIMEQKMIQDMKQFPTDL